MKNKVKTLRLPPDFTPGVPREASIVQIYGGELGKRHSLVNEITIGRDAPCSVILNLPSVSRQHARLFNRGDISHIIDLQSTNGTYLNGEKTEGETPLSNGDLIKIGSVVFKFIEGGNIEALYHEEMYQLAIRDGLTGIHNKRYFLEFLQRELSRSLRYNRPLSLALMDIDHFKEVNDSHGHQAGDHLLQRLAAVIMETVRGDELMARYGGEEFAFVLPETKGDQARSTCERIRKLVEKQIFEFENKTIRITVSLGVASFDPGCGAEELIGRADSALYKAKAEGRNRTVVK